MAAEIRRGDIWEFQSNFGVRLTRYVKSVACGVVFYRNGSQEMCRCSLQAFRRWTKGATLIFATNWEARKEAGDGKS